MSMSSSLDYSYDVFLSFRGEDTRRTICSHLYEALVTKGIRTFRDDREIDLGDSIPVRLRRAIETSRFALVIISKNYASSRWCLEELELIMELRGKNQIRVIPVFYNVDPDNVMINHRRGFALTSQRSSISVDQIRKWREALRRIVKRKGTVSQNCTDEATMVKEVVGRISRRLSSLLPMDLEDIVGMEAQMEDVRSLLDMESKDEVRMIGIWGMRGIGKTTLAKCLYDEFKHQFSAHCFMEDVSSKQHTLFNLQKQLISKILGQEDVTLWDHHQGATHIKSRFPNRKALIVLDDVDEQTQLEFLARDVSWFGKGSRIIITTQDKSLLNYFEVKNVHKVSFLDDDEALQLFYQTVFQGGKPPSNVYKDLSNDFSKLAQGLPLALETFGSYLRNKSPAEWQDALKSFKEAPNENIMKELKISYDRLDNLGQTTFLHVACLFNGEPVRRARELLEQGRAGIRVLEEKSLIDISADGHITMHRLLEQTGRQIVRQESRILWHPDDIYSVLAHNAGTSQSEGVVLDVSVNHKGLDIKWDVFRPMHNLTFLKIYNQSEGLEELIVEESLTVPHKLRLLHWDAYPYKTLPSSMHVDRLTELNMCYSKLETLWSGTPKLLLLRRLNLRGSKYLKQLPDLQGAVCLEELVLEGCISLKRIPKSICNLPSLQKLDVSNCDGLQQLKMKIMTSKSTVLQGPNMCYRVVRPYFYGMEPFLNMSQGSFLTNASIKGNLYIGLMLLLRGYAEHLSFISEHQISGKPTTMSKKLESPPYNFKSLDIIRFNCSKKSGGFKCDSFSGFPWLLKLNLINLNIQKIPEDIHHMQVLEELDLSGNGFQRLPTEMNLLTKLKQLTLCNCHGLEELPGLSQLERLTLSDCTSLRKLVKLDQGSYSLLELWLDNCKNVEALSDELSHFTRLTYLDLSRHDFEEVPTSIKGLTSLVTIYLNYCNNLKSLTGLPKSLKFLNAHGCKSLQPSSLPIKHFITHIDLSPCPLWKQNSSPITRFPAGRYSNEVPVCACASSQETTIPITDNQETCGPVSVSIRRLKPWLWDLALCMYIVGLASLLVTMYQSSQTL